MNSNRQIGEPSGIRLLRLMDTRLPEIIRKERKNERRVCLYGTGEYWTAFEQSAYLLCRLFPAAEVSIVTHPEEPFPVVMASISDDELRAFARQHIFCRDLPDYKEILVDRIIPEQYRIWHQKAIRKFSPALAAYAVRERCHKSEAMIQHDMNIDAITLNECKNDGSHVHLYSEEHSATGTAYGISAYILEQIAADCTVSRIMQYSFQMMMPSITLSSSELRIIVSKGKLVEKKSESHTIYHSNLQISMDHYIQWAKGLRAAKGI